jgi:hypothetical protein
MPARRQMPDASPEAIVAAHRDATSRCPEQRQCHIAMALSEGEGPGGWCTPRPAARRAGCGPGQRTRRDLPGTAPPGPGAGAGPGPGSGPWRPGRPRRHRTGAAALRDVMAGTTCTIGRARCHNHTEASPPAGPRRQACGARAATGAPEHALTQKEPHPCGSPAVALGPVALGTAMSHCGASGRSPGAPQAPPVPRAGLSPQKSRTHGALMS